MADSYAPVALGFLSGGVLLQFTDWWLSRMQGSLEELDLYRGLAVHHPSPPSSPAAGTRSATKKTEVASGSGEQKPKTRVAQLRRLLMLIIAITIHNFPEGMAVGVAFGAIESSPGATFGSAATLALGIGIQNFPVSERAAVAATAGDAAAAAAAARAISHRHKRPPRASQAAARRRARC